MGETYTDKGKDALMDELVIRLSNTVQEMYAEWTMSWASPSLVTAPMAKENAGSLVRVKSRHTAMRPTGRLSRWEK